MRMYWETFLSGSKEIFPFRQLTAFLDFRVHALKFMFSDNHASVVSSRGHREINHIQILIKPIVLVKQHCLLLSRQTNLNRRWTNVLKIKLNLEVSNRRDICLHYSGDYLFNYCPDFRQLHASARRNEP